MVSSSSFVDVSLDTAALSSDCERERTYGYGGLALAAGRLAGVGEFAFWLLGCSSAAATRQVCSLSAARLIGQAASASWAGGTFTAAAALP